MSPHFSVVISIADAPLPNRMLDSSPIPARAPPIVEGSFERGSGCVALWRGQGCKCPAIPHFSVVISIADAPLPNRMLESSPICRPSTPLVEGSYERGSGCVTP